MFAKSSPGISAAMRSRAAQSPGVRSAWASSCRRARSAVSFCWRSSSPRPARERRDAGSSQASRRPAAPDPGWCPGSRAARAVSLPLTRCSGAAGPPVPRRVRAVRCSGLAGGGGQQRAQALVGDAVAVVAELAAERLLAEPLAVPAGVGQDARGGCDDLAVEVRILAAVGLPAVRGALVPAPARVRAAAGRAGRGRRGRRRGREAPGRAAWSGGRQGRCAGPGGRSAVIRLAMASRAGSAVA